MPRSRKTTGRYTGFSGGSDDGTYSGISNYDTSGYGTSDYGSDYSSYNTQNYGRNNNSYMNNDRNYGGTGSSINYNNDYGSSSYDNNDYGYGSSGIGVRYNQGNNIYGDRYSRNTGRNLQGRFGGSTGEPEGHWLDKRDLERNRYYGSDDRSYSNRYGRGMYANREERYEDEDDDMSDVRMDLGNYDDIGHEGNEDIEDVDSNYDNLYTRDDRGYGRDWTSNSERNYDIDDYRR